MKNMEKIIFGNQLERIRLSRNLLPEQVSNLLGFKTTRSMTHFEKGRRIPSLKIALELAIIYNVPIRVMLDGYYEACLAEVRARAAHSGDTSYCSYVFNFCSYEQELSSKQLTRACLTKIRRHSSDLIRKTAEKIGHI
jgi:transcriptional regulator with XRE-family HTH domain